MRVRFGRSIDALCCGRPVRQAAVLLAALQAASLVAGESIALAQSITNVSITKNAGNSADEILSSTNLSYERTTTVATQSSTATSFTTRYAEVVGTDTGPSTTRTETQATDYTVQFTVTAPGWKR